MSRLVWCLAVVYVALLPIGRSGLPLNAQWGDILLPFLAIAVWRDAPREKWWRRADWPLAVYLAVTLVASIVSPEPAIGLQQLAKQAYVASIFLVFRRIARDAPSAHHLQRVFLAAVAAVIAVSIPAVFLGLPSGMSLESWFGDTHVLPYFGLVPRLRGAFEAQEMLGDTLLVAFLLALALRLAAHGRARLLWTAVAALLLAGEVLTVSHSVAGFAVAAVLFVGASVASRSLRFVAWILAAVVVTLVNVASVLEWGGQSDESHGVGPVSFEILGTRVDGIRNHYFALKQVAWGTFVANPLLGVGPGRFPEETERAFQAGRLTARHRARPPHCDVAGRFAEAGVFGGLSLVLLWASWLRAIPWRLPTATLSRRAAGVAVVGLLINSVNADVMNFRFLWLALAWAWPREDRPSSGPATEAAKGPRPD